MSKEAYYFPHYSHARHDRKVKRLMKQLGVEGYGIFFMLLEVLREQSDLKYPIDDIDLLADEFGTSEQKVKAVIFNYDLFNVDKEKMFFSPKLIQYMKPYFEIREKRRVAGIKSGESRRLKAAESNKCSTSVEQVLNNKRRREENNEIKEIKEKNNESDYSETPPVKTHLILSAEELREELLNSYQQIEKIMKVTKLPENEVKNYIIMFVREQDAKEDIDRPLSDIKKHLVSWVKTEQAKVKKDQKFNQINGVKIDSKGNKIFEA